MANKRMFSLSVIDTDQFLDMPQSTQNLYFHLGMRADDDGFIGNAKKIMRTIGASEDDIKVLITKKYIIPFESGVIVIRHWRLNNYLQKDRHKDTIYQEEKSKLTTDNSNVYNLYTDCIHSIDKNRLDIDKNNIYNNKNNIYNNNNNIYIDDVLVEDEKNTKKISKHKYGKYKNVLLKDEELEKLQKDYSNWEELIEYLDEYIERKGYKAKSHYLCIKKWVIDAVEKEKEKNKKTTNNTYEQRKYNNLNDLYSNGG